MSEKRDGRYMIILKEYVEGYGWIDEVRFVNSLSLDAIREAIPPDSRSVYNDDAEMFEVKKVKKPLFPEDAMP